MVDTDPSLLDRPVRNWLAYAVEMELAEQDQAGGGDIEIVGSE